MSLSWRVHNIVVIGRIYLKLERSEFSSNFEFDRNMLSGTGAWPGFSELTGGMGSCSAGFSKNMVQIATRGNNWRWDIFDVNYVAVQIIGAVIMAHSWHCKLYRLGHEVIWSQFLGLTIYVLKYFEENFNVCPAMCVKVYVIFLQTEMAKVLEIFLIYMIYIDIYIYIYII